MNNKFYNEHGDPCEKDQAMYMIEKPIQATLTMVSGESNDADFSLDCQSSKVYRLSCLVDKDFCSIIVNTSGNLDYYVKKEILERE